MNATVCRDVAFDTVIMVKQTPRRMLAAVQEVCGGRVLIPDETAREAGKVYVRVAAGQARRETQWKATEQWGADWSGEQREAVKRHTLERTREKVAGFRRWLDEEVGRNDGPYRRAAGSAQADLLAQEIAAEAFLDDETLVDRTAGDPLVLAQALLAGAEIVGSDNMVRVRSASLRRWMEREQGAGRFKDADPQLVRTGDEIVAARLYTGDEETLDGRIAAVACGVCRPDEARDASPRARWRILSGFAAHLEAGGMPETAQAISRCQDRWRGRVEQFMDALEDAAPRVQGTRESERRRTVWEHAGSETATVGTPSRDVRGGIGT